MTYKESLHRIWLIAKREVHRLVAQPNYFFCMQIAPAIWVIFFVSLMHEGLPTDLPIAVVDMDNSATSRNLIRQLDAFEQTEVYMKTSCSHSSLCIFLFVITLIHLRTVYPKPCLDKLLLISPRFEHQSN